MPLFRRADDTNAARRVRCGILVRVARGIYSPTDAWTALSPGERYLARVHAVALSYPDAIFVGESGCALRGLPVFGEPPDVHVMLPAPATSRRAQGMRVHTSVRMPRHEEIGGIRVAALDELAVDIAHTRHAAVALAVADAALRADDGVRTDDLIELAADRPSRRGIRSARWVLARADGTRETALESVSAAAIEWLGFPTPDLQPWFRGPTPADDARVDFWWDDWRVAGESDGVVKYSGAYGDAREALAARNARDAVLLSRGVRATAHWGWRDVAASAQLRAALVAAGLPIIRPASTAPLHTLAAALRGADAPR
ncbi:hypothetical protein [Microbacterium dextranolyticum]|uniref:hypothetical protein n=1 Tax=Microbacterium dextranolyticum TaxID=36806 RepID=UPI00195CB700|nr:hypothetical protein [Microbacterium dextranolyticum]MBM7462695.1 hypothetical protein [Microbacterium dextranolyticum]